MPNYKARNTIQKKHIVHRMVNKTNFVENGCWLFNGSLNKGHGQICLKPGLTPERVHRISTHFFLDYDFDSPLQVNHKQDCPNKNCWNPEHIYVGSQLENMQDMTILGKNANQWKVGHS